jgi:hypothetical protein
MSASALTTAGAARKEAKPTRKPRRGRMRLLTMLSCQFHTHRRAGPIVALCGPHRPSLIIDFVNEFAANGNCVHALVHDFEGRGLARESGAP